MPTQSEKRKHHLTEIAALDGLVVVVNQARALRTAGKVLSELLVSLYWWAWNQPLSLVHYEMLKSVGKPAFELKVG